MVQYEWTEENCRDYAEEMRPMVKYDHKSWAKMIAEIQSGSPEKPKVIDIASGPAFLILELKKAIPDAEITAHDSSVNMLKIAAEEAAKCNFKMETLESRAEELPVENDSFDVVTCKQLLHEAANVEKALSEIFRITKSGGRAFVIDFDSDGSKLMALAIRTVITLKNGGEIAKGFWTSFKNGLRGSDVKQYMENAGFKEVVYKKSGMNYMIYGLKP